MLPNPQFTAYLVTFTEEIFNGKLHFLCSVVIKSKIKNLYIELIILLEVKNKNIIRITIHYFFLLFFYRNNQAGRWPLNVNITRTGLILNLASDTL